MEKSDDWLYPVLQTGHRSAAMPQTVISVKGSYFPSPSGEGRGEAFIANCK